MNPEIESVCNNKVIGDYKKLEFELISSSPSIGTISKNIFFFQVNKFYFI